MDPRLGFLVYRSRSGSTLFGDRLSRHPKILVAPESRAMPRLVEYFSGMGNTKVDSDQLVTYLLQDSKLKSWGVPADTLRKNLMLADGLDSGTVFYTLCATYRDAVKPGATIVVVKKGDWYYRNMMSLLGTFPGSVSIWIFRDPRGVYNSSRKALHSETGKPLADGLIGEALLWREYYRLYVQTRDTWEGKVFGIQFENMVRDLGAALTQAWQALGVVPLSGSEMDTILRNKHDSHLITEATRHLHSNVASQPMSERANGWRSELPWWQSRMIKAICRHGMRQLGYQS